MCTCTRLPCVGIRMEFSSCTYITGQPGGNNRQSRHMLHTMSTKTTMLNCSGPGASLSTGATFTECIHMLPMPREIVWGCHLQGTHCPMCVYCKTIHLADQVAFFPILSTKKQDAFQTESPYSMQCPKCEYPKYILVRQVYISLATLTGHSTRKKKETIPKSSLQRGRRK